MKRINLKRVLSVALAVLLVMGMVACESRGTKESDESGSGTGPQEINIQLVFWGAEPPAENCVLYKEIEEALNIKLNINYTMAASAAEKTNTMLVGGDLPDVMLIINDIARSELMQQAGEAGMFWDLNDYLADYPNLAKHVEPFRNSLTYDGHLIGLPRRTLYRAGGMLLREDWLEKLNLSVPKTLDDFYNVFKAFTYDDPDGNGIDDTVGLAMFGGPYVRPLMLAAGIDYDYYVDEETQEVKNFCTDPNFQTYLDFVKKLYDEGLVSQDFASMNAVQGREVFNTQKAGAYTANYGNISGGNAYNALYENNPDAKIICITDVQAPDGTLHCETSVGYYGMYVMPKSSVKTEKELKGILKYYDYICSPEIVDKYAFGIEGKHYEIDDKGSFKWLDKADKEKVYAAGSGTSSVAPLITETMGKGLFYKSEEYYAFQTKEGVKDHSPVSTWFTANTDDAATSTVVAEAATKYVMGEAGASDVANAVQEWLKNGGQSHLDDWTQQYKNMSK